jgi:hypothetical protein
MISDDHLSWVVSGELVVKLALLPMVVRSLLSFAKLLRGSPR